MKSYDEIAKNVLKRRYQHNKAVVKRNRIVTRVGVSVLSLCLAVIVGIGYRQYDSIKAPPLNAEDAIVPGIDDVIDPDEPEISHKCNDELIQGSMIVPGEETNAAIDIRTEEDEKLVKETYSQKDECGNGDEIWIEPHWAEKMLYSKYPEFEFEGITYSTAATWIHGENIGGSLGMSTAHGYDIYEDKAYEMGITVYPIKGIGTDAAVAVGYDGFPGQYAVYTARWYEPETLGDFIDTLNLRNNITFGTVYHTYYEYESYIMVEYYITDPAVVWDMILSDGSLVNVSDNVTNEEMSFYKESMSISVNVDILGVHNVSLGVTENGYLTTNILGTRKLFYIGEEKVNAFIEYVSANYEGVREEYSVTTKIAEEPVIYEDIVATAITQISPPYDPEISIDVTLIPYVPSDTEIIDIEIHTEE